LKIFFADNKERLEIKLGSPGKRRNPYAIELKRRSPIPREEFKQNCMAVNKKRKSGEAFTPNKKNKSNQESDDQSVVAHSPMVELTQPDVVLSPIQEIQEDQDFEIHYGPNEYDTEKSSDSIETIQQVETFMSETEKNILNQQVELEIERNRLSELERTLVEKESDLQIKSDEMSRLMSEMKETFRNLEEELENKKRQFVDKIKGSLMSLLSEF
jgi:hypothetical protein